MNSSQKNGSVQKARPEKNLGHDAGFEVKAVPFGTSLFSRIFVSSVILAFVPAALLAYFIIRAATKLLTRYARPDVVADALAEVVSSQLLIAGGGIVILAVLFAYVCARSITRPIAMLIDAVRHVAAGDFSFKVSMKRTDEIGQLAHFFNVTVERFRETQERGLALSQIKSQFVTVAAHQLRTPLSAMKWILRLMLDGDMGELTDKQSEFLQQGYQTNERMIRLVNDFLDISRIEEGRFGFHFKKIRIIDIIQKAIKEWLPQAELIGVTLVFESTAPADLELIADEDRIYMVMENILDNAIRYNHKDGDVLVSAAITGDVLEVRITDTGIGVPLDEQEKLFSRFYRASNAIRQQTEGSGLGLFITKNIIGRHGGTIRFMTTENKGTTVFFTLPVKEDFIKKQTASEQMFVDAA
ncbi:MAG: integral membrane sensor signal transduction histidine kinase [Parcubacteria group bacterium Gr01-1014_29]|nr:MAG: integral membrane sensor signal transduction histidine kinase [Parcubacteria group bacterium Gr01-1014_29]